MKNLNSGGTKSGKTKKLFTVPEEVVAVNKIGGYWYWNWTFPFRHFEEEKVILFTKKSIYQLGKDKNTLIK